MSEYEKTGKIVVSAMKADMHPQTASKYIQGGQPPQQMQEPRTWRTRPDPLEKIWDQAQRMLQDIPELEAKTLFEYFLKQPGSGLDESHLRTFYRRVRHWSATQGPAKEVYFGQERNPGELMELDWTRARELGVTIQGELLDHMFCHCVLPYSNWEWATRCTTESFLSLLAGLQAALGRLGKSPPNLATDNTSAATHDMGVTIPGRPRAYNSDYLELCTHFDLSPLTINVGCPNEQGDVETLNGHLKRRLKQRLILRGSRDFASVEEYDRFVEGVLKEANSRRRKRLEEELARMRALPSSRLAEYREYASVVSSHSLIHVNKHTYSVPSRLIGHTLRVHLHESELKVYLGRDFLFCLPRLRGRKGALVDFRHVIDSLMRKPGAFIHYRHRQALYPSTTFRQAYDRLVEDHGGRLGLREYLQVLKLAAQETVEKLEPLLKDQLSRSEKWHATDVRDLVSPPQGKCIELASLTPSLSAYDALLEKEAAHVS